jgi:hypothetical protein
MTDDSAAAGDDPAVVMARHKRRRKKKTNRRIASSSDDAALNDDKMEDIGWRHNNAANYNSPSTNNCCSALDEELENQVNRLIVQSRNEVNHNKKRHACEMADDMSSCEVTNINNANRKNDRQDDMSTSLPVLLHIREIGLSSRLGRCNNTQHIPFINNVDSLDANGRYASWMNLLLHQPTYSPRKNLKIGKPNNINHTADERKENDDEIASDDQGQQHANNAIRRLRVPIHNRHALNNNDEDGQQYYYNTSTSTTEEEGSVYKHKSWRPYTQQTIQFSRLKTPHSAAILAMNQWGGYSIGVVAGNSISSDRGRGDNNNMMSSVRRASLTLNFYGIPSPARLLSIATDQSTNTSRTTITSPLLHSIPLLFTNNSNSINNNNAELEDAPMHNICDTPIQILLCSNGAFGIGYILDSQTIAPHRNDIFSKNPSLQVSLFIDVIVQRRERAQLP